MNLRYKNRKRKLTHHSPSFFSFYHKKWGKRTTICTRDWPCSFTFQTTIIDSIGRTVRIVPRAEIHTVCQIFHLAKKVNRSHVHSVRASTVISHRCVMVTLHFQHSKEDRAHTTLSIASNCKYKHQTQLIHFEHV